MKQQNKQLEQYVDTVAQDFRRAIVVVSLVANLTIFVSWLTLMVVAA